MAFLLKAERKWLLCGDGLDRGEAAAVAMVRELDASGDLGKESVVRADADVGAGLDLGSALAHDDGSAGDELATEGLYAKALCI